MKAATWIRQARLRAGLTQRELARRAGTSQPTISSYEAGSKEPTVSTLVRLLDAAGARLDLVEPASTLEYLRMRGLGGYHAPSLRDFVARVHRGEDFWFALREQLDAVVLVAATRGSAAVAELLHDEPPFLGDARLDAFVAGLAEHLAVTHGCERPAWALRAARFLPSWWFPHRRRAFDALSIRDSPAAFRRRGIFLDPSMLQRR